MQNYFKPRIGGGPLYKSAPRGPRPPFVIQPDPPPQSLDRILGGHALDFNLIDFGHAVLSGSDVIRERAIIREQQQAFGVEIKTAGLNVADQTSIRKVTVTGLA